ncbi:type II toxin-antitoxin system Phd/YefM family antitoxin [Gloeocapsa sp. PCC 73106]|uniref:type II toxin-antitoxin system Phd/YefM family antitoxin n=1 Tax=Gloeocapsa sp. PCC 73106 TaxID=102232 RepID=UPI0002ABD362|nr:type II toxin-antitoxin system Phd/YefM family antitoxin [Gloeocapsa sp. PCC 73106]ELS00080.1 hypothetical protein GLO73106DRAFT_00039330 [Gloeocapsa sp. PCC 73106]
MIIISSSETRENWGEIRRKAQRDIIEVQSHGKPDVYILSPEIFEDYQRLKYESLKNKLEKSRLQAEQGHFSEATADDIVMKGDALYEQRTSKR